MTTDTYPESRVRLFSMKRSGNSHRVRLFLSLLEIPHEVIEKQPGFSRQRDHEFLGMNPFGLVPVIIDGDTTVFESTAILVYLAERYGGPDWLPQDPIGRAEIQKWLALASGPIMFGIAAARRIHVFGERLVDMQCALNIALDLLQVLESYFASRCFAVGNHPTIADVAAYSYLACADEAGIDMSQYPNVGDWLRRIEALPGFIPVSGR